MGRRNFFMFVAILIALQVAFGIFIFTRGDYTHPTCEDYADMPMSDVPARCAEYFR